MRPVEYLERARLARRRRLARALRAPGRPRGRALRRDAAPASRTARPRTRGSARGSRRSCRCVRAGAPVGLGVDGAASNEAGELGGELRQALLVARLRGGPAAMTCARGARARHAARRALPRPRRRARHAGGRQARRHRAVAARRPRPRRASTTRSPRWCSAARPLASTGDRRRARSSSRTASCAPATRRRSRASWREVALR